ncbi:PREDICTED: uncharacterized protein K02A2.6-like [Priapulus caudatus]|uniref:Uncharacterized protein K02A2.6-like n=1 Tax=Priapulus caudatus TaxID=37621 RepID=A0ABM1DQ56_PRICU|nr:PREDICTED: uncharacterized protein K02A2.6-like [Priapulus caudatus]
MSALPERPWSEISTDFEQVPGMGTHFMVISDFSRYVVVEPVSSLTANAVIPVLDKIIGEFGVPDVVKSDNGPSFNSSTFSDYARHKGFKHRKITPLWPLANAEAERFMKTVKKSIKAAIAERKTWNQELHSFLLNYRATPHSSTGIPPATLMFGRAIKTTLPRIAYEKPQHDVRQKDSESKARMKVYADRKAYVRESGIKIGEPVLMKRERMRKSEPPFDPKPLIVTKRNGSMVTAECHGKTVTRNSSRFKRSPTRPEDVPTSSDEEEEELGLHQYLGPDDPPPDPVVQHAPRLPEVQGRPQRERRLPDRFKDFVMA